MKESKPSAFDKLKPEEASAVLRLCENTRADFLERMKRELTPLLTAKSIEEKREFVRLAMDCLIFELARSRNDFASKGKDFRDAN